jgi:hypothetical protein
MAGMERSSNESRHWQFQVNGISRRGAPWTRQAGAEHATGPAGPGKIEAVKNKARQSPGFVSNLALQAGQ